LIGWNQDGCTNVRHYPRRVIGTAAGILTP